jgi:hypothetical protein
MNGTQHPAGWKSQRREHPFTQDLRSVKTDDREDAAWFQEAPKSHQRGFQRQMVERRNNCYQVKAIAGKWIRHYITLHESEPCSRTARSRGPGECFMIEVNGNYFLAVPCQLSCEQALAASHI